MRRGLALPGGKTGFFFFFFKVINEVYFWCRNKQIEQLYRIENSETGHAYMEMIG